MERTKRCVPVKTGDATAIICGSKIANHERDDKNTVYSFFDGYYGDLKIKAVKEGINPNFCDKDILDVLHEKGIQLQGVSVACSKCGRAAMDEMWRL